MMQRNGALVYQDIYGLVNGAFGDDVFDAGLVNIHGPTVFKNRSGCVEVLGTVQLVGAVKEEISCLVSHSWGAKGANRNHRLSASC